MSERIPAGSAPLLGANLVWLLYLDEAGTDRVNAPVLCVAGVMIHGDIQYPLVERRIIELIEKYVPEDERHGFIFHATDIYHGARFFDRRKPEWADRAQREAVLLDLAQIVADLKLPVMVGRYDKVAFGQGVDDLTFRDTKDRESFIHSTAAFDCLMHADRWLAEYAPTELARVTHEDGTPAKSIIKNTVRAMRSPKFVEWSGVDKATATELALPLKRIVDSVSFEDKRDARPLQLADLCAFIFGRMVKGAHVPPDVEDILVRHGAWTLELSKKAKARSSSDPGGP